MSETPPEGGNSGETPPAQFTPITSQEELNKLIGERIKRVEAKFADYKDIKSKAEKLDEYERANQTEAEKAAKRIADLEAELETTRLSATRSAIAAEFGLTPEQAKKLTHIASEEGMREVAEEFKAVAEQRSKQGNRVPREGAIPEGSANSTAAFAKQLFGGAD